MKQPLENNREKLKLTWALAKNDFISKYASSQLGIFWAFFKPAIQACVYIFIFTFFMKARTSGNEYPYALWLLPGLIVWFFFSEAVTAGSTALLQYSYLVKKIRFDIRILPTVKVLSSTIVHCFFVALIFLLYIIFGMPVKLTIIQLPYYVFCAICIALVFSRINCSITPFFRDFSQLLDIMLIVFIWTVPIMWNIDLLPEKYHIFVKINPLYYLVDGYRHSFMGGTWFFERPLLTGYFWLFLALMWIFANKLFNRLQPHFADIL